MRTEKILLQLGRIAEADVYYSDKAKSLINWYYEHDGWTKKQKAFCCTMITHTASKRARAEKAKNGFRLYAIDDGVNIKLGYAKNPDSRLKSLQTGNAYKLKLLWVYPAGDYEITARKLEKQLHRYCRKFKKRGEWFSKDCLPTVQKFEAKRSVIDADRERKRQEALRAEEAQELEIVSEAMQHI